jgi:hypothetical protein
MSLSAFVAFKRPLPASAPEREWRIALVTTLQLVSDGGECAPQHGAIIVGQFDQTGPLH